MIDQTGFFGRDQHCGDFYVKTEALSAGPAPSAARERASFVPQEVES